MKRITFAMAMVGLFCATEPAAAFDVDADMKRSLSDYARSQIESWVSAPVVIDAIRAQNAETGALSQSEIETQDQLWAAERKLDERPLITAKMENPISRYLAEQIVSQQGRITEVIVMDARGLNVAITAPTSDIWQGDEPKYSETYLVGPDAMHVSEVEQGESSQIYQVQVSMTVADPETSAPIGAVTVSIDLAQFF